MKECTAIQTEISALLDGEGDPTRVMDVLEHVGACPTCGPFVRELRSAQADIDRAYGVVEVEESPAAVEDRPVKVLPMDRPRRSRPRAPWAWGLAAALVLSLGAPLLFNAARRGLPAVPPPHEQVVIRLGEDPDALTEERFVAMVTELLRADPVYRDEMFAVLTAVRDGVESDGMRRVTEDEQTREAEGLPPTPALSTAALN